MPRKSKSTSFNWKRNEGRNRARRSQSRSDTHRFPNPGFVNSILAFWKRPPPRPDKRCLAIISAEEVAEVVYRVVTDPDCPLMVPAGADAAVQFKGD